MVTELTDKNFEEKTAKGVTLTDFWAPWCGPCRMQTPVLEQLSESLAGKVEFFKMNVDEEIEIARQFGIMSIPTLVVKKDGQIVEKLIGLHDKNRLTEILNQYI